MSYMGICKMIVEQEFNKLVQASESIIIFSHVNPDGDTLGSMLALSEFINLNYKKSTTNVIIGKTPTTYSFLSKINNCKSNTFLF